MKYRKKPVVIEAIEWDGGNINDLIAFASDNLKPNLDSCSGIHAPTISTLEGEMRVSVGDYVIRGVKGEFYPCKPEIFEATYEAVSE
jgi:hypothetical protein